MYIPRTHSYSINSTARIRSYHSNKGIFLRQSLPSTFTLR